MSAAELQRAEWLDTGLWEQLERLESRHRLAQWQHRLARLDLQRRPRSETQVLRLAWQRYCEVLVELDRATAEIEILRQCASRAGGS